MTVAKDVVQFLINIFGDRQAAQEFLDNPERVLQDHGLGALSSADVDAAMPVVLDYAPVNVNTSTFDRVFTTGGNNADGGVLDDHGHAVEQLANVVANYSYPSNADDRAAGPDPSPAHNIWADGEVEQWFDNDAATAGPAAGPGTEMSFADIQIDHLFDVDAGADAGVGDTVPVPITGNSVADSLSQLAAADTIEETIMGADDSEFGLTGNDFGAIAAEDDADDAGGDPADYLEFGA